MVDYDFSNGEFVPNSRWEDLMNLQYSSGGLQSPPTSYVQSDGVDYGARMTNIPVAQSFVGYGAGLGSSGPVTQGPSSGMPSWLNKSNMGMLANAVTGVAKVFGAKAAMNQAETAREDLAFRQKAFGINLDAQRQAYGDTVRTYNYAQDERQQFANATHADPSLSNFRKLSVLTTA
mgnify:CR=1|tara:strand:- start:385 stop:912 length:528 start_codon:yes stop_codon:yes gene_type:complete